AKLRQLAGQQREYLAVGGDVGRVMGQQHGDAPRHASTKAFGTAKSHGAAPNGRRAGEPARPWCLSVTALVLAVQALVVEVAGRCAGCRVVLAAELSLGVVEELFLLRRLHLGRVFLGVGQGLLAELLVVVE